MVVLALSRHSGQRHHVERDSQATDFGRAGKRHRAVPHVRREQDEQPRARPHEIFRFQPRCRRKGRLAELQPTCAIPPHGRRQLTRGRDPAARILVVDVKPVQPHRPDAADGGVAARYARGPGPRSVRRDKHRDRSTRPAHRSTRRERDAGNPATRGSVGRPACVMHRPSPPAPGHRLDRNRGAHLRSPEPLARDLWRAMHCQGQPVRRDRVARRRATGLRNRARSWLPPPAGPGLMVPTRARRRSRRVLRAGAGQRSANAPW